MESLQTAEYCGHTMPLHVWVDAGASEPVASYVASLEWPHGSLQVTDFGAMGQSMGIRGMWTNVTALGDHHHVLPLEDDIEVSPLYYWWLLFAAARWGPFGDAELALRTRRMVGVSLYTPRLNEIAYPQAKWLPEAHTTGAAFLLQVPCSWGALFWLAVGACCGVPWVGYCVLFAYHFARFSAKPRAPAADRPKSLSVASTLEAIFT